MPYLPWQKPAAIIEARLRAARVKITVNGTSNSLNYSLISKMYMIWKCGRGTNNTTWRSACGVQTAVWTPLLHVELGSNFGEFCNEVQDRHTW